MSFSALRLAHLLESSEGWCFETRPVSALSCGFLRQEIGVGWVGEPCKRLRIDPIVLSPALWQIVKLISR